MSYFKEDQQTDPRLPRGVKSWTQLAEKLISTDEYNARGGGNHLEWMQKSTLDLSKPGDQSDVEIFKSDILTVKVRAFDEIRDHLPTEREVKGLKSCLLESNYMTAQLDEVLEKLFLIAKK